MDILDGEVSEDEAARKDGLLNRPPSHEANTDLVMKDKQYRDILRRAAESDAIVRDKWSDWEQNISDLTLDEVCRSYLLRLRC